MAEHQAVAIPEESDGMFAGVGSMVTALQENWLGSFLLNVIGYGLIILPAALAIRKWKESPLVKQGHGPIYSLIRLLVLGDEEPVDEVSKVEEGQVPATKPSSPPPTDPTVDWSVGSYCWRLIICILGLQGSYLTWGVLQERVMTRTYNGDSFNNSQFLVFVNRILAFAVAGAYICVSTQPRHRAPFYKYSYASISNTFSSWCQYEALKFVSFPTQVLAKASKVIPVMVMGKIVSNRTYPWREYVTAALLSIGVGMFLLAADSSGVNHSTETTFAGIIILMGYMTFDSFTSNWQSEVFRQYHVSSIQMMFGVNLFSCILTIGSLLFRGVFFSCLRFLFQHTEFAFHALLLSICSAVGQLFIFHTIQMFGPLIFTLIMTTRQAISILISCLVYQHVLTVQAILGVLVVFVALFLRTYFKTVEKKGTK